MVFKTTRQDAPAKQNHTKFPRNTSCIRQGKSVFSQGNLDSYFFEASSRKIKYTKNEQFQTDCTQICMPLGNAM
jgi:hypothetical protein